VKPNNHLHHYFLNRIVLPSSTMAFKGSLYTPDCLRYRGCEFSKSGFTLSKVLLYAQYCFLSQTESRLLQTKLIKTAVFSSSLEKDGFQWGFFNKRIAWVSVFHFIFYYVCCNSCLDATNVYYNCIVVQIEFLTFCDVQFWFVEFFWSYWSSCLI
jgi:hypothetical protein